MRKQEAMMSVYYKQMLLAIDPGEIKKQMSSVKSPPLR